MFFYAIIYLFGGVIMEIDEFMSNIDIRQTTLKETVARYATEKGQEGMTLIEVIHLQTAYIDKLRKELL